MIVTFPGHSPSLLLREGEWPGNEAALSYLEPLSEKALVQVLVQIVPFSATRCYMCTADDLLHVIALHCKVLTTFLSSGSASLPKTC